MTTDETDDGRGFALAFAAVVLAIVFGFGFAFGRVSYDPPPCASLHPPPVVISPTRPPPPVRGYMMLGACWHGTKWGRRPHSDGLWSDHGDVPPLCRKPFGYPAEMTLRTRREARLMSKPWSEPMEPVPLMGQVKPWAAVRLSQIQSSREKYGDDFVLWMAAAEVEADDFTPVPPPKQGPS